MAFPRWSQLIESLFDGLTIAGGYLEVFKNPSLGEMRECVDYESTVRAFLTPKGFYIWSKEPEQLEWRNTIHSKIYAYFTRTGVSMIGTPIIPLDVEYGQQDRTLILKLSSWSMSPQQLPTVRDIRAIMKKLPREVWAPYGGVDAIEVIDEQDSEY